LDLGAKVLIFLQIYKYFKEKSLNEGYFQKKGIFLLSSFKKIISKSDFFDFICIFAKKSVPLHAKWRTILNRQ